jgi:hypothetical protein
MSLLAGGKYMAKAQNLPVENDFFTILGYVFSLIKDSWEALKLNFLTLIFLVIIPTAIALIGVSTIAGIFVANGFKVYTILIGVLLSIILLVILALFAPAITITQLVSAKGQKINFKDAFKKSLKIFWPFIGLTILVGLSVIVGLVLLIIPGLLAAFFFSLSIYILIDKNTAVKQAMRQSYHLVKANWKYVLALYVVNLVVSFVGRIPLIGSLISAVLSIVYFCLPAIVYLKIRNRL